jgi:hypothetical protein
MEAYIQHTVCLRWQNQYVQYVRCTYVLYVCDVDVEPDSDYWMTSSRRHVGLAKPGPKAVLNLMAVAGSEKPSLPFLRKDWDRKIKPKSNFGNKISQIFSFVTAYKKQDEVCKHLCPIALSFDSRLLRSVSK